MSVGTNLLRHIEVLASDQFAGRAPGSEGEAKTIEYLAKCAEEIGLEPAGDDLTYFQKLAVTGITADPCITFNGGGKSLKPSFPSEFVAQSKHIKELVEKSSSDLVFVGYGIEAPEYGWNDYEGIDVHGKTVVVLIGQPARPDSNEPDKLDPTFFKGSALTYYGRWTYKYEKATEMGAAAALIVHDSQAAGYGYDVVKASWSGENYQLDCPPDRVLLEGWLSSDTTRELFEISGLNFDSLKKKANHPGFRAVELKSTASFQVKNTIRHFDSHNVVAKIDGDDSILKEECVVYSAHWDHFGTKVKDDQVEVYSGAIDNGSGVAMTLEIARMFKEHDPPRKRSAIFLFTTLEESGLLGSQFYVENASISLQKTVAVINMDVMNVWGRTKEIVSIALGHSSLDDILSSCAAMQDRVVVPDPEPEKGYFFRSDHLAFLQKGIPALFFLFPGSSFIDRDSSFGMEKRVDYIKNDYHKPSDKVKEDWDLSGAVEDVELLFDCGLYLINARTDQLPVWNPKSEFATT